MITLIVMVIIIIIILIIIVIIAMIKNLTFPDSQTLQTTNPNHQFSLW